jgi:hypothetical protein
MTHSLHRYGNEESLREDYVVLTFDNTGGLLRWPKSRLRSKFPLLYALLKKIYLRLRRASLPLPSPGKKDREDKSAKNAFVFTSKEALCQTLQMLKDADTGKSVVVSGLFDEVKSCLDGLGLPFHTVQFSLGCFGKTELLPEEKILEVTTMCGHHMISPALVKYLERRFIRGKITSHEAARIMGNLCVCRIFNEYRAAKILERSKREVESVT